MSSLSIRALPTRTAHDSGPSIATGVDWVALSFDGATPRKHAGDPRPDSTATHTTPVIAKIESSRRSIRSMRSCPSVTASMVARGSGVEMPAEGSAAVVQKELIRKPTRVSASRIITATQMLDSIGHLPRPTRGRGE